MNRRPQLLFLCQTLPYPLDIGQAVRTYHVLKLLAASFDITALCFYGRKHGDSAALLAEALAALNTIAPTEAFPIPQDRSRPRLAWDHARSLLSRHVYTRFVYDSDAFRRRLHALVGRHAFDMVHVDSLDLSGHFKHLHGLPVVCVHHNVESELLHRRAAIEHGWRRRYVEFQARRYEAEERYWLPRLALNVAVSEPDARDLRALAPGSSVTVVPNGVDVEFFQPTTIAGDGIAFLGGANWFPNKDGMDWFCGDILPRVRAAAGPIPVRWIGRATDAERTRYAAEFGVEMTGWVPDVRPHLQRAACLVVPLRVGGGTRLKILDAWAMGLPVVSTSVGAEGLAAEDGHNVLIRDEPATFADAVAAVLRDPQLRRSLGQGARATVERSYSWPAIGERMTAEYLRLLDSG